MPLISLYFIGVFHKLVAVEVTFCPLNVVFEGKVAVSCGSPIYRS